MRYQVIDHQTWQVVGNYSNAKRARNSANKKDLEYGAIRYGVRRVEEQPIDPAALAYNADTNRRALLEQINRPQTVEGWFI